MFFCFITLQIYLSFCLICGLFIGVFDFDFSIRYNLIKHAHISTFLLGSCNTQLSQVDKARNFITLYNYICYRIQIIDLNIKRGK